MGRRRRSRRRPRCPRRPPRTRYRRRGRALGQLGRQQAALQRLAGRGALGVEPGVIQRQGRPAARGPQRGRSTSCAAAGRRARPAEHERAERCDRVRRAAASVAARLRGRRRSAWPAASRPSSEPFSEPGSHRVRRHGARLRWRRVVQEGAQTVEPGPRRRARRNPAGDRRPGSSRGGWRTTWPRRGTTSWATRASVCRGQGCRRAGRLPRRGSSASLSPDPGCSVTRALSTGSATRSAPRCQPVAPSSSPNAPAARTPTPTVADDPALHQQRNREQ